MALIPIKLPAGVYRTGTDFEGQGRWLDSNLVRWRGSSLRPVGGWSEKWDLTSSLTASPRDIHIWMDNTADTQSAVGTCNELVAINEAGTVTNITPVGFVTGNNDAVVNTSFGGNFYGTGLYGTKRPYSGVFQEADTWTLDNYGEYLVGCCTSDGKLYEWQLNTATPAAQITNSPTSCKSLLVTDERFIFALQAGGNPRKIAWCDREDNTVWAATAENEAGDYELQTNGEIMFGLRMRGRSLIVTNTDAHIATYIGPPYVYGFENAGYTLGAVSRHCGVSIDTGAFWMGREAFYVFDGSSVRQLECDVADFVFDGMNHNQSSKVFAVHNSEYGEIWWFFPSDGNTEVDRYVSYDYTGNHWEMGYIGRTCGFDQGVLEEPIWITDTGVAYEHELHGVAHGSETPYAETSVITMGNGDNVMVVNQMIPDEETQGEVQFKFKTRFHPNDTEREYGPYQAGNPTSLRVTGRQIRMRVEATSNEDFRVGTVRLNTVAGGRR